MPDAMQQAMPDALRGAGGVRMPRPDPSRPGTTTDQPVPTRSPSRGSSTSHPTLDAEVAHASAPPRARGGRGRRHNSRTILAARTLAEKGGWTAHEIQQHLTRTGTPVSFATVKAWLDDDYRRRRNHTNAEDKRRGRDTSGQHVKARILDLAARGVSDKAISVVVELYHGRSITPSTIREYRRLATREGQTA